MNDGSIWLLSHCWDLHKISIPFDRIDRFCLNARLILAQRVPTLPKIYIHIHNFTSIRPLRKKKQIHEKCIYYALISFTGQCLSISACVYTYLKFFPQRAPAVKVHWLKMLHTCDVFAHTLTHVHYQLAFFCISFGACYFSSVHFWNVPSLPYILHTIHHRSSQRIHSFSTHNKLFIL